jgi:hypothetical protein
VPAPDLGLHEWPSSRIGYHSSQSTIVVTVAYLTAARPVWHGGPARGTSNEGTGWPPDPLRGWPLAESRMRKGASVMPCLPDGPAP